jgi:hypothetical protein
MTISFAVEAIATLIPISEESTIMNPIEVVRVRRAIIALIKRTSL